MAMSTRALIGGYKNFEDCDESGFVSPRTTDSPSASDHQHAARAPRRTLAERLTLLNRRQRWLVRRLDALLEEPLTREATVVLREMRRAQASNLERGEALLAKLI
jgi:hypothetical protein